MVGKPAGYISAMKVGTSCGAARIAFVAISVILVGCATSGSRSPITEPQPDVDDAAIASAVDIRALGCAVEPIRGAGAVIEGGFVLTAAHVVAGAHTLTVRPASPEAADPITAHVVAIDPGNDLALLSTPGHSLQELPLLRAGANDRGVAIVFRDLAPVAEPYVITRPVRVRILDIYHRSTVTRGGYQVAIEIDPGDSGAVLVGPTGAAVGVLYAKSQGTEQRAWASSTSAVPALIARARGVDPIAGIDPGACAGWSG